MKKSRGQIEGNTVFLPISERERYSAISHGPVGCTVGNAVPEKLGLVQKKCGALNPYTDKHKYNPV